MREVEGGLRDGTLRPRVDRADKGGLLTMTQFMICSRRPEGRTPEGVVIRSIADSDSPAVEVAKHYFPTEGAPQIVLDKSGSAAPLVDAIWERLSEARDFVDCPLVQFLGNLMRVKIAFVLWCSDDFDELPRVRTVDELLAAFRKQASMQPADVFLWYSAAD